MKTHVDIQRKEKENSLGALKRFSQKVRSSGIVMKVKSQRFSERQASSLLTKQKALRRIERTAERDHLRKLGKVK